MGKNKQINKQKEKQKTAKQRHLQMTTISA